MVMKIEKFNDSKLKDKCKNLFDILWSDKLGLSQIRLTGLLGDISLYCKISRKITDESYDDFEFFFRFLKRQNIHFSFGGEANDIIMSILNLQEFVNEMETLQNSKKYNL